MKRLLFSLLASILSFILNAQDLLVKKNNDSLNVTIIGVDTNNVYLTIMKNDKPVSTYIDRSDIISFTYNYYSDKFTYGGKLSGKIDVNIGGGYMTGKSPEGSTLKEKEYLNKLRLGFAYDLNLHAFFTKTVSVGIKYNQFYTSNGNLYSDNIRVRFVGPSFCVHQALKKSKGYFVSGMALGNVKYINHAEAYNQDLDITGSSFGFYPSLAFDFLITPILAFGFNSGMLISSQKNLDVNGISVNLDKRNSVSLIDGMIGFKLYL